MEVTVTSTEDPKILAHCAKAQEMAEYLKEEGCEKNQVPVVIDDFYCIVETRRITREEFHEFITVPDGMLIDGV